MWEENDEKKEKKLTVFPSSSWKLVESFCTHIFEAEQHLGSQMYSENVPRHCLPKKDMILLFFFIKRECAEV